MLSKLSLIALLAIIVGAETSSSSSEECVDGPSVWYSGNRNYTKSGYPCQRWDVRTPHVPLYIPKDGGKHNYCRNPDHDVNGTWCYVNQTKPKWEYCKIPKCPDDSKVVWTNLDTITRNTHLYSLPADAEIVREQSSVNGNINVSVIVSSRKTSSEFWAVTSDYRSGQIFFADYRSQYVGVHNIKTNATKLYLQGMGHGIENMAYDWVTGNLYMSDSTMTWILVSSSDFKYYNYVYKTFPDLPYGVTLHAKERYLYFSTYKSLGSKIIRTDMAGKNATVLFKFPQVFDVTGMTVDYADNKLYWTDFPGYGSLVMSSNLDGTNRTQIYFTRSSIFWGVASYLNHVFVTDVHMRITPANNQRSFYVWWISKTLNQRGRIQVGRYKLKGKPRGITIMSKNVEYSTNNVSPLGSCESQPPCEHLCLPRINAVRECACAIGYIKEGSTSCTNTHRAEEYPNKTTQYLNDKFHFHSVTTNLLWTFQKRFLFYAERINNNFMIVSDAGQGKIFQLRLQTNVTNYILHALPFETQTSFFAIDIRSHFYFWVDKKQKQINKATSTGTVGRPIATDTYARSLAMEPNDGNLYFIDDDTQHILLIQTTYNFMKTLLKPDPAFANVTNLKQLTIDLQQKFVYWTDTNSAIGQGQVWRMRYDGSGKELVFDKLYYPHAITVDHANKTLFFSEAKLGIIYAVPIKFLQSVNGSIPVNHTKYNFAGRNRRLSYIAEIQIYKNNLYFYDRLTRSIEVIDTTIGVSSLDYFAPRDFYRVRGMAVWSKLDYIRNIAPLRSDCTGKCRQICVSMGPSRTNTKCLCKDGSRPLGNRQCVSDGSQTTNQPPSYGGTCTFSFSRILEPCVNKTLVGWIAPSWTDDRTPKSNLTLTFPSMKPPIALGPGRYPISYSATDSDGAVGHCRFSITIKRTKCRPLPKGNPDIFVQTPTYCSKDGKVYNITCRNPNHIIHPIPNSTSTIVNRCFSTGNWLLSTLQGLSCKPKPNISLAPTTAISISTSPISTSKPAKKLTTSTTTTTLTATINSVSASTSSAKQMPTSSSATGNVTLKQSSGKPLQAAGAQALAPGATVGIVIAVIVVIVVVALVVAIQIRRKPSSKGYFPIFWKPKGDKVNLRTDTDDASHHYALL